MPLQWGQTPESDPVGAIQMRGVPIFKESDPLERSLTPSKKESDPVERRLELQLELEQRSLDDQHSTLRRRPAVRRESAELSARGEDAVAGDDDRERVPPERLADRACAPRIAELRGEFAVGARLTRRDRSRELEHAPVELQHVVHVERDVVEAHALAAQQGRHAVDRTVRVRARRGLASTRVLAPQPRDRRVVARLRKLHAGDAAVTPRDAAAAECGVEQRKSFSHDMLQVNAARYFRPSFAIQSAITVNIAGSSRPYATNSISPSARSGRSTL